VGRDIRGSPLRLRKESCAGLPGVPQKLPERPHRRSFLTEEARDINKTKEGVKRSIASLTNSRSGGKTNCVKKYQHVYIKGGAREREVGKKSRDKRVKSTGGRDLSGRRFRVGQKSKTWEIQGGEKINGRNPFCSEGRLEGRSVESGGGKKGERIPQKGGWQFNIQKYV